MSDIIYLLGYMGAGKSTVGRKLAKRLGVDFLDLDKEFEKKYKHSISSFFQKFSEKSFRELEQQLLKEVSENFSGVCSVGGGTPCFHNNMDTMNNSGITIFLNVDEDVLFKRLYKSRRQRPLFNKFNDTNAEIDKHKEIYQKRKFYYSQAKIVIELSDESPAELVDIICNRYCLIKS
ncbi:MAG: shikimate kinase [Lentimicrobiaceae bacterium]|nr:shikimate kinase [Lentimicrobiaceae bacterium]